MPLQATAVPLRETDRTNSLTTTLNSSCVQLSTFSCNVWLPSCSLLQPSTRCLSFGTLQLLTCSCCSGAAHRPSAVNLQLSTLNGTFPPADQRLRASSCRPSAAHLKLSTISCTFLAVDHQLAQLGMWTNSCVLQLSTTTCELSAVAYN